MKIYLCISYFCRSFVPESRCEKVHTIQKCRYEKVINTQKSRYKKVEYV